MINIKKIQIVTSAITMLWICQSVAYSQANTKRYEKFLKPVQLFQNSETGRGLLNTDKLYLIVANKGANVQKAKQDYFDAIKQSKIFERNLLPTPSLSASDGYTIANNRGQVFDANGSEEETFNRSESRSRRAGLKFNGSLPFGFSYGVTSPEISKTNPIGSDGANPETNASVGYNLNLELLKDSYFAQGTSAYKLEDLRKHDAILSLKSALLSALVEAQKSFYDLVLQQLQLAISRNANAASKAFHQDMEERLRIGDINRMALIESEVAQIQSQLDFEKSENTFKNARETLIEQLNLSDNERSEIEPDLSEFASTPPKPKLTFANALATARQSRPDFLLAKNALRRAKIEAETAAKNKWPKLTASFSRASRGADESTGKAINESLDFQEKTDTYTLSFNYILWNDPAKAQANAKSIAKNKAEISFKQLEKTIAKEIRSLLLDLDYAYRTMEISSLKLKLAERKLKADYLKFKLGESSMKDLIDAQQSTNRARVDNLSVRFNLRTTLAQLRTAMGVLPKGISMGEK